MTSSSQAAETPKQTPEKVHFAPKTEFSRELKRRVTDFFESEELSRHGNARMYLKSFIFLLWICGSYGALVFAPLPWWAAIACGISLGLAMAGVGFSVMHDGGHRSFSKHKSLNSLAAFSLDLLGGSSYVWRWKHNILHHSYANITYHDDDLNVGAFGRLSPYQAHYKAHRYQHIYMWLLYGFLPAKWQMFDDFNCLFKGKIGVQPFPRPKGADLAVLLLGKALFYTWAFVVPLLFFPLWIVLCFYLLATFVEGIVLATVFQMAHCVEEAEFPEPAIDNPHREVDWYLHQLQTTINFAPHNRLLTWYVGGLNFQIEHHLFPRITHLHYPAIAKIVRETCAEFGMPYQTTETLSESLRSHYRWLQRMGQSQPLPCTQPPV